MAVHRYDMRSIRLSDHDALTGLLARKPFQLRLEDALAHAKSVGGQISEQRAGSNVCVRVGQIARNNR